MGFPGGSDGKESACNAGDLGSIPGLGRSPGGGHGNPLQYSCLENPQGQRSLVGYSPWSHKESDTTEWLSTAQHSTAQHSTPVTGLVKRLSWKEPNSDVYRGRFPTPTRNSQTPDGCPLIQCNSDTIYPEMESDSRFLFSDISWIFLLLFTQFPSFDGLRWWFRW